VTFRDGDVFSAFTDPALKSSSRERQSMGALARAVVKAKQLLLALRRGADDNQDALRSSSMPEMNASKSGRWLPSGQGIGNALRRCASAMNTGVDPQLTVAADSVRSSLGRRAERQFWAIESE